MILVTLIRLLRPFYPGISRLDIVIAALEELLFKHRNA